MISGIYQSANGLNSLSRVQEGLANNLANISTTGFKKELMDVEQLKAGRLLAKPRMDFQSGPLQMTGVQTQMALGTPGYFVVNTPQGPAYTRNGNFSLDNEGRLVTAQGYPVQGEKGDIVVGAEGFTVSETGEVTSGNSVLDRLQLVDSKTLQAIGNGLFVSDGPNAPEPLAENQGRVMQGTLEGSNVDMLQSMVDMVAVVRLYEANQKALTSQDETLKQAITEVGRTA